MREPIECEGTPRDLGLDQGRACADALRMRFGAQPWWERFRLQAGLASADRARLLRDLKRHFPHQWESLAGMAVGARVPTGWLAQELAGGEAALPVAVAIHHERVLLARGLGREWVTRRSRPEGLFASVEVTYPCLTAALAGVNERGLAVAAVGTRDAATERCAAPASLLAQDCLERFEATPAALEWCLGRPGGGRGTVWLADARGELASVEFAGAERRVLRPSEGLLVSGGGAAREEELAKALREAAPLDAPALARRIEGDAVALDPRERRLVVGGLAHKSHQVAVATW
ncbi:MAG: hypothetical protein JRS35_09175 [Deltaproteobacteria bacterium]|nr:hypothetical protein [Deltaproteobacteria bacterium]